jgi:hypothetical protein
MSAQADQPADPPSTVCQFVIGASCAIVAVSIWAGWLVVMRLGVTTRLSAPDLAALGFATAGLVLIPVVLRHGFAIDRLGWSGSVAIAGVRFGHSTSRRRGDRRPPPRKDVNGSRAGWRLRQSHHLAPALSSTRDDSRPHHAILDRKIAARLFKALPAAG